MEEIKTALLIAEIANHLREHSEEIFGRTSLDDILDIYAARDDVRSQKRFEGIILVETSISLLHKFAIRILNDFSDQSLSYKQEGFTGIILVTKRSLKNDLTKFIEKFDIAKPSFIFLFDEPDMAQTRPFVGKLVRYKITNNNQRPKTPIIKIQKNNMKTLWAHVREGSTEPSAFYNYLLTAKSINKHTNSEPNISIPKDIAQAVQRASSQSNPIKYLSYSTNNDFHSVVWRNFWFRYVLTDEVIAPWKIVNRMYVANNSPSKILRADGQGYKLFFYGRSDSIKNKLVNKLNYGTLDENQALIFYVENIRKRAHSYREDIDSSLLHLGFLNVNGELTKLGYQFLEICEVHGGCHSRTAKALLGAAILKNGQLGVFLHYISKLSDEKFKKDRLTFTSMLDNKTIIFSQDDYLNWLEGEMANNLNVVRKVSLRGGRKRKPFQAELAILRQFGFVSGFQAGLGLRINWDIVNESLDVKF